jgi:hypothetical protein
MGTSVSPCFSDASCSGDCECSCFTCAWQSSQAEDPEALLVIGDINGVPDDAAGAAGLAALREEAPGMGFHSSKS